MKYINIILLFSLSLICCEKVELPASKEYPILIAHEVSDNDSTGVTLSAKFFPTETEEIIDYGFILSYDKEESKMSIINQSSIVDFKLRISKGLEKLKAYSYWAYVQTNKNMVLSNVVNFISLGSASPRIIEFSPVEGFDSTLIIIRGDNFENISDELKAFVNDIESHIEYISNDTLKIRVPQMAYIGNVCISIKSGAKTIIADKQFNIIGPVIESVSGTTGYSGSYLTLSGKYLTNNGSKLNVWFGNNSAEITQKSENRIDLIIPIPYSSLLDEHLLSIRLENGLKSVTYKENFLINNSWERKNDPPFVASWMETFCTNNNKAYFLNINEKNLYEYDQNSDSWSVISTYPDDRDENSIFICRANKLLKIGGDNYQGTSYKFWEFNILTKEWKQRNDIPFRFNFAATFILNDKLYFITDSEEVWVYNDDADTFTRKKIFPDNNIDYYISFVAENKAYIVNALKTWEYDGQNDTWTYVSSNPFKITYNMESTIGFNYKGTGYVLHNGSQLYRYDVPGKKWALVSEYPESSTSSYKSTFVLGNKAYIGTLNASTSPYPRLFSYED